MQIVEFKNNGGADRPSIRSASDRFTVVISDGVNTCQAWFAKELHHLVNDNMVSALGALVLCITLAPSLTPTSRLRDRKHSAPPS